jgi:hypothetical protein
MNRPSKTAIVLLVALPLLKLVLHLAAGAGYGYHGDELYYLACANHLDWSYVDHPSVSILILAATRALAGESVTAIRVVPAIAGALTVLFVGLTARRMGGGALAQALAMVAAIASPFYMAMDAYFSMNSLDLLVWAVAAWLSVRILSDDPSSAAAGAGRGWWIALGLLLGVGVENKISVIWLGGGLFLGLLLTPRRSLLRTSGPWIAVGIAALCLIPQIVWQATHDLATVRWMMGAAEDRPRAPLAFLVAQRDGMLPIVVPMLLAGLVFFFGPSQGRRYQPLGWAFIAIGILLALSSGRRPYYLAPAYTWLLAGGAVALEGASRSRWARAIGVVYLALIALRGLQNAPFVLPILPEARIAEATTRKLPDFLAQMSGLDEIVDQLADTYDALPAAERERAMVLVAYYPIAGAVDVLGRARGLPQASSSDNNYWLWGPHGAWDGPVIVLGYPEPLIRAAFSEVTQVATTHCAYCREPPHAVLLARGLRIPPETLWHELKYRE